MSKSYSTKRQKALLASAGIPYVRGRSFAEAQVLIDAAITRGQLSQEDLYEAATARQLEFLQRLGVPVASRISKSDASALIDRALAAEGTRASERQLEFIRDLGGE